MNPFHSFAEIAAAGVEACAVFLIVVGAVEALARLARLVVTQQPIPEPRKREVWAGFASWLLIGLEFELAADVMRTAVAPTWTEIGQLASIAVIRTLLGYFLTRDVAEIDDAGATPSREHDAAAHAAPAPRH